MNDLSWMLYWADMAGSLPSFIYATTVAAIFTVPMAAMPAYWMAQDRGFEDKFWSAAANLKWIIPLWFAVLVAVQFVPSRDTIYAIAASEMGEEALKSPIATKAGKALEKWLDDQISDDQKKGE